MVGRTTLTEATSLATEAAVVVATQRSLDAHIRRAATTARSSCSPQPGLQPGISQPPQLVGQRARPVVPGRQRRGRPKDGVNRHDHVGPARSNPSGTSASRTRPNSSSLGESRRGGGTHSAVDDQVEGSSGSGSSIRPARNEGRETSGSAPRPPPASATFSSIPTNSASPGGARAGGGPAPQCRCRARESRFAPRDPTSPHEQANPGARRRKAGPCTDPRPHNSRDRSGTAGERLGLLALPQPRPRRTIRHSPSAWSAQIDDGQRRPGQRTPVDHEVDRRPAAASGPPRACAGSAPPEAVRARLEHRPANPLQPREPPVNAQTERPEIGSARQRKPPRRIRHQHA